MRFYQDTNDRICLLKNNRAATVTRVDLIIHLDLLGSYVDHFAWSQRDHTVTIAVARNHDLRVLA